MLLIFNPPGRELTSPSSMLEHAAQLVPSVLEAFLTPLESVYLSAASRALRAAAPLELVYRRLCFAHFLSLIISGPGGFASDTPRKWFTTFQGLVTLSDAHWASDDKTLRGGGGERNRLRSDRNDYVMDMSGLGVLRSGGNYFFNISFAPLDSFNFEASSKAPPAAAPAEHSQPTAHAHEATPGSEVGVDELMASMAALTDGGGGGGVPTADDTRHAVTPVEGGSSPTPADRSSLSPGLWARLRADPASSPHAPAPCYHHTLVRAGTHAHTRTHTHTHPRTRTRTHDVTHPLAAAPHPCPPPRRPAPQQTPLADRRRLLVIGGMRSGRSGGILEDESATSSVHVMRYVTHARVHFRRKPPRLAKPRGQTNRAPSSSHMAGLTQPRHH